MENREQPRPSQVLVHPLQGRGTLILRDWDESGPTSCRLCVSGCRAFRAADTGLPCCIGLTPDAIAPEDGALYRERLGMHWLDGPPERRIRP